MRLLPAAQLFHARAVCRRWRDLLDQTESSGNWCEVLGLALGLPLSGKRSLTPALLAPDCDPRATLIGLLRFRCLMAVPINVERKDRPGPTLPQVWAMLNGWEQLVQG